MVLLGSPVGVGFGFGRGFEPVYAKTTQSGKGRGVFCPQATVLGLVA